MIQEWRVKLIFRILSFVSQTVLVFDNRCGQFIPVGHIKVPTGYLTRACIGKIVSHSRVLHIVARYQTYTPVVDPPSIEGQTLVGRVFFVSIWTLDDPQGSLFQPSMTPNPIWLTALTACGVNQIGLGVIDGWNKESWGSSSAQIETKKTSTWSTTFNDFFLRGLGFFF